MKILQCLGLIVLSAATPAVAGRDMGQMAHMQKMDETPSAALADNDVRNVVLVVNRDGSDVSFVSMKTHETVGRVSLGEWVGPHMAMFSMDGRKVVVSGTKANKAYIIDYDRQKVTSVIDEGFGPEHFDISPDNHYVYMGNFDDGSVSVIDLTAEKEIKRLGGFAEPHNITFTPDGSKAYVANFGAHWVGVIDASRHELLKRIQMPMNLPVRANSDALLGDIHGIINVTLTRDGTYGYAADGDLGVVGIIDTRTDELVKVVPVGRNPWRAYASGDGKTMWIPNNGDNTVSVLDTRKQDVVATLDAGPDMTGVNFASGKAYVISSSTGEIFVYNLKSLIPAGRIVAGKNVVLETGATDAAGRKIYTCGSNTQTLYEIDAKTDRVVEINDVGLFPWGSHVMNGPDNYCH